MSDEWLKISGTESEIIKKLNEIGLSQQTSKKLLSFLTKEKNIICEDETYRIMPHHETPEGNIIGFMLMEYDYFLNIRVGTVFLLCVLIDNCIGLPITSGFFAIRGLNRLVEKIDENKGVKCILLEILRLPNKKADANILTRFCGECCNNDLDCCFRDDNHCMCTSENAEKIMQQLEEIGILKKEGNMYCYDALGIM